MSGDVIKDSVERQHSKLAVSAWLACGAYWLALFVMTHLPLVPKLGRVPGFDKVVHLGAFAGLAFLLCTAGTTWLRPSWRLFAAVLGIVAVYSVFDELTQMIIPYRTFDLRDCVADLLGAGLGISAFSIFWEIGLRLRPQRAPLAVSAVIRSQRTEAGGQRSG